MQTSGSRHQTSKLDEVARTAARQRAFGWLAFSLICSTLATTPLWALPVVSPSAAPPSAALEPVAAEASRKAGLEGRVLQASRPLSSVRVYAYEVASFRMQQAETDKSGFFSFHDLPAGMYKLVAFKSGFLPTVELLLRQSAELAQKVELQLREEQLADKAQGEDYWTVRGRVPVDVLRQIQSARAERAAALSSLNVQGSDLFAAEMRAVSGVEQLGAGGQASTHLAEFGVRGSIGQLRIGVDGSYQGIESRLAASSPLGSTPFGGAVSGAVRTLGVDIQKSQDQKFRVSSSSGELAGDDAAPVGLDRYEIDWQGRTGSKGRTRVSASFIEQTNYHLNGWLDPDQIPWSSQSFVVDGSYSRSLGEATQLQAGASYLQKSLENSSSYQPEGEQRLGLYGLASTQVGPRVLIEYGLFSSVRGGSLSLTPHGGVVVTLGSDWQARGAFSQRVEQRDDTFVQSFSSAYFGDHNSCRAENDACYQVSFTHGEDDHEVMVGAIERQYAETLRLYFSRDFFNRLESVFVVDGDELPELQFSMTRRLAPRILTRLESNLADGGGGVFYATDDKPYENEVRYLVTSLDTHFQRTATGVFVAFHHLEQSFKPVGRPDEEGVLPRFEIERLQLMLTQDLNVLLDLASKWAVRLNMELSRGSTPYTLTADNELSKKLTGGLSVSF